MSSTTPITVLVILGAPDRRTPWLAARVGRLDGRSTEGRRMIGEIIALVIVVVMPVTPGLGLVSALGLAVAGFAIDPEERRLVRR